MQERAGGVPGRLVMGVKLVPLLLALLVFFTYGLIWTVRRRGPRDMRELYELFYVKFLRLKPEQVEVVRITDNELITVSRNPCPILRLSLALGVDTRLSCRLVSETVCRFVLRRMDPRLVFWRDYERIRPYSDGCLEVIRRV